MTDHGQMRAAERNIGVATIQATFKNGTRKAQLNGNIAYNHGSTCVISSPKSNTVITCWANVVKNGLVGPTSDGNPKTENFKLKEKIIQLEENNNKLSNKHEKNIFQLTEDNKRALKDLTQLKEKYSNSKRSRGELKQDARHYREEISQLKEKFSNSKRSRGELKQDARHYQEEISELKEKFSGSKRIHSELKQEVKDLTEEIVHLKKKCRNFEQNRSELERNARRSKEENVQLERTNSELKKRCGNLERMHRSKGGMGLSLFDTAVVAHDKVAPVQTELAYATATPEDFSPGKSVNIVAGKYNGMTGLVAAINPKTVTVLIGDARPALRPKILVPVSTPAVGGVDVL
eukprot:CAMPEP_0194298012 /NCGR_PEP_ID=MMETSP0169-20130528/59926_1 /TAXON_ID=218684 /ORGANISM="Corethron pennatum, Strain L29A3" /LENGTH=347 /DNA_ID=CAMNT_0039047945 /DNA_START=101 /DNA_END=1144 /DNA_ORIENTATION=-